MEVVQILNDGNFSHNQWGGFVSLDSAHHQGHVFQDVVTLAPVDTHSVTPQYYFVDTDGSLLPILEGENIAFLAAEADNEIPSWKLDHMYSKKPRDPGMEQVKPTKRRSKKKELLTSQFFVQEMVEDTPPKINIIRQRHAPGYSRPKILTSPQKFSNPCSSTNSPYSYSSSTSSAATASTTYPGFNTSKVKMENDAHSLNNTITTNEDFSVPSPGAVVTVCDGMELDPIIVSSRNVKSSRKFTYNASTGLLAGLPAQLEIRNSSLDSIGEPEDESELFFDFPMEEEETAIDVDFNELPMNTGCVTVISTSSNSSSSKEILGSTTPITFFQHNTNSNNSISTEMEADQPLLENFVIRENHSITPSMLSPWDSADSSPVSTNNNNKNHSLHSTSPVRKRGRPRKNQPVNNNTSSIDSFKSSPILKEVKEEPQQDLQQCITPTRRSTRPVKAPSRLDDIEDSPKRKRRTL